ncbi:MAG TPA: LysM peptidoglycan-binding domain-containing protein [Thermoanaerobaculia bacterium]|nr:LysM peptidoglycan-binding domain-containing protein [Thermoanaerobaculia bacterium]
MSVRPRAKFQRLTPMLTGVAEEIEVSYNPTELTFSKSAQIAEIPIPGLDSPILQFVRGQTETLSVELFFDSTDDGMGDDATAVTEKTDRFYQLIKIDRSTHAPPVCRFIWGDKGFAGSKMTGTWASQNRQNGFQCVVESVKQRFTLFNAKGRPLRATLTLSLKEYRTLERQIAEIFQQSPDHTHAHVVQRGDTLARIAAERYANPAQWRAIADENRIDDPLELVPGTILEVPPLR